MNSNQYLFSVVVALIGMTTVFTGLTLLSLMMALLRRIFRVEGTEDVGAVPSPLKVSIRPAARDTRWVVAAVAAYLSEETHQSQRSAARWRPRGGEAYDAWLTQPRI